MAQRPAAKWRKSAIVVRTGSATRPDFTQCARGFAGITNPVRSHKNSAPMVAPVRDLCLGHNRPSPGQVTPRPGEAPGAMDSLSPGAVPVTPRRRYPGHRRDFRRQACSGPIPPAPRCRRRRCDPGPSQAAHRSGAPADAAARPPRPPAGPFCSPSCRPSRPFCSPFCSPYCNHCCFQVSARVASMFLTSNNSSGTRTPGASGARRAPTNALKIDRNASNPG
jgi:hypothetical protein